MKTINTLRQYIILPVILTGILFIYDSSLVNAQGTPMHDYTSGVQVAHLYTTGITVTLAAYDEHGAIEGYRLDSVSDIGSRSYITDMPVSNFEGAMVLSSEEDIAAISNLVDFTQKIGSAYVGSEYGDIELLIPLLQYQNSGFNSWYSVQNIGIMDAEVLIQYSDGLTVSTTISPGAAKTFYQDQEAHLVNVPSAIISSTNHQPLVAVVIQEDSATSFAYTAFSKEHDTATHPIFPLVNSNNSGYITGIQIQNAGSMTTTVTVSYTPSAAGNACVQTKAIGPVQAETFALDAFDANGGTEDCQTKNMSNTVPYQFVGAAQVTENTNDMPLVAVVNQLLPGTNGGAYGAFSPDNATRKVVLPLIMDRNSGYSTGFSISHVSGPAAKVYCTFTGKAYTYEAELPIGGVVTPLQKDEPGLGPEYVGSATCETRNADDTDSTAEIVAIVNELNFGSSTDELLVYEGINVEE
ncbi:MAG: hypothetical protein AAF639_26730 [Chloroflexota bacterium]